MTTTRYAIDAASLADLLGTWGEPGYRARQVWRALHHGPSPLTEATALPRELRDRLEQALPDALVEAVRHTSTDGATTKWRWRAARDGAELETVLMESSRRATVCISSQAGCAMGCTFCATGQGGFRRHLDACEMVEQVRRAEHHARRRATNVVFMGMGEPLANFDPVWSAVERLHVDVGISARRITISTVGLVPGMRRLAASPLPVTLAVSLHAPDDALREQLVPLDRRYPIAAVLDAARACSTARGRRVTFEYACIEGVNDAPDQADALARLLGGFGGAGGSHVNLIPLNPTPGFPGRAPPNRRVRAFAARLRAGGVHATVRRNRGVDIEAACGQLGAGTEPVPGPPPRSDTMAP